ncbi:uncharacterized protein CMU_039110 [Cryptosporidium muris RN66]|uniref:Uncharacterized protein n=1 Tax=Cryptosporidium muris (strain RN66) TaxID=441375 RepID=B6A9F3_CRYMR|nr:uncharacterized protein CMU_039110 [Cryptosporidium muris RN66]EEA04844.1 hypothetical protein CMU_039110 [Cryptosporidium muris RN66]|eukprot:XP_002139193.1 hypothetical protein [Cryptosporidium muris RN66]
MLFSLIIAFISFSYYIDCCTIKNLPKSYYWNQSLQRFSLLTKQSISDDDRIKCRESELYITPWSIKEAVFSSVEEAEERRIFLTKCITYYSELSRDLYFKYLERKYSSKFYQKIFNIFDIYIIREKYLKSIVTLGRFLTSLGILLHKTYEYGFNQKGLKYPPELEREIESLSGIISVRRPYTYSSCKKLVKDAGIYEILINISSDDKVLLSRVRKCSIVRGIINGAIRKANESAMEFLNRYKISHNERYLHESSRWKNKKEKLYLLHGIVTVALAITSSDILVSKK